MYSSAVKAMGISRIQNNIKWIQTVDVKSLHLKLPSSIPFEPSSLLRKPLAVEKFVVEMEPEQPAQQEEKKVDGILQLCRNLKALEVYIPCHFSIKSLREDDTDRYPLNFFQELLKHVEPKTDLKELDLSLHHAPGCRQWSQRMLGMPAEAETQVVYPGALKVLKLHNPFMRSQQLQAWKPLLDAQAELSTLHINFGLLYWEFFSVVLQRNARSLQHLNLLMVNTCPETDETIGMEWPDGVPFDANKTRHFDWDLISLSQRLKSLKISMTEDFTHHSLIPYKTKNFQTLSLNALEELELKFVSLSNANLTKIFTGTPSLRIISLRVWTQQLSSDYLRGRARELCNLVNQVLPVNRLRSIELNDYCTDEYHCPQTLRNTVEHPFYNVEWIRRAQGDLELSSYPWNSVRISRK
jgi:hypothetical protein